MLRIATAFLVVFVLIISIEPLSARPEYLARFQADPFRRSAMDGCAVCHENPKGGGARNEFGAAFEAAGKLITPMMRANFPDRFEVETLRLTDGSFFYFSDPENRFVVYRQKEQKFLIDLSAVVARAKEGDKLPPATNRMSFFITSRGLGSGGHFGGLAGADRHCQALAESVGAGDRTWRAYLSTSFEGQPLINAGDRIGSGPWYNAKGMLIARGPSELHNGNRLNKDSALTEKGEGIGEELNRGDILTGSLSDGKAAIGMNCNNWTSSSQGNAMTGRHDSPGKNGEGSSWNSGHTTKSCSQDDFKANGSDGLFYCFAYR